MTRSNQQLNSKKILIFTFGECFSGVYKSQVLEILQSLRDYDDLVDIQLFAIISPRNFSQEKRKIIIYEPTARVLPSLSPLKYWFLNKAWFFLYRFNFKNRIIISRGVFATCLALDSLKKSKIIYDGRGAVAAEQEEFQVYQDTGLEQSIASLECKAVNESDGRIAVSKKLVNYWRDNYQYTGNLHQVIPCTVSEDSIAGKIPSDLAHFLQKNNTKAVFTFAGGNAKWQGIENLVNFLRIQFEKYEETCAILLTDENEDLRSLIREYPGRIIIKKVIPDEVIPVLSQCDYGMLLREINVTNKVASPVKVAEYLQAGLKVLISSEVGDYSEQIEINKIGFILKNKKDYSRKFEKVSAISRKESKIFCKTHYSKNSVMEKYLSFCS